jgi:ABC-type Fe3+-hydroxamate transport system substrate-binding protein
MSGKPTGLNITDDLGDTLVLERLPRRIVSLVPSITETVIELGAGERLVGVTNYCIYPAGVVGNIPKVGGTKGFSLERIDGLQPDLILANKEENRRQLIEALREKYPVFVTYPRTVVGADEMVVDLGRITGREAAAAHIAESCDRVLTSIDPSITGGPLRTACMIWRDPWMAAGPDSYMSDLLETFGFKNVFTSEDGRYPETTVDAVVERDAEVIILPDEPYEFGERDQREVEELIGSLGHRARVLLMEGSLLTWFGARTLKGLERLYRTKADLTGSLQ